MSLTLSLLGATCPATACHAKGGTEPRAAAPNAPLDPASKKKKQKRKKKTGKRAETPAEAGEVFFGGSAKGGEPRPFSRLAVIT